MFVDASAIIAIIAGERDAPALAERLGRAGRVLVSPIALYEAATGLARARACSVDEADTIVAAFVDETAAELITIDGAIGREAVRTFARYGRGRHPADLNMGDCFAYACAQARDVPLLFKGHDFTKTDIRPA